MVRTSGGLIVKQAARQGRARELASDKPAVAP